MSICFYPSKDALKKDKYRVLDPTQLSYGINKIYLQRIMEFLLSKKCCMKIIGYNKKTDVYWCKQTNSAGTCYLFINITIHFVNFNSSIVVIKPVIGRDADIENFIEQFKNTMNLFEKSTQFTSQKI